MTHAIPDDPAEILKCEAMEVVPYRRFHAALAERLGLDSAATLFAVDALPLCQTRASHATMRRAMAETMAERSPALRDRLPQIVAAGLAPLSRPGRVDVMAEVVAPMVSAMISGLCAMDFDVRSTPHISRVFSLSLGVARRRKLEAELAALIDELRFAFPTADMAEIGRKLSLAILGRDALIGTLGASLHALLSTPGGQRLDRLDWPEVPPVTGVPYINRETLCPVQVGDTTHSAGVTLRADLARYQGREDRQRLAFFGSGAHLCLGRALTLDLWREIGRGLVRIPLVARVEAYGLRRDDVFHMPGTFTLELVLP